jgi:hypothetical protein
MLHTRFDCVATDLALFDQAEDVRSSMNKSSFFPSLVLLIRRLHALAQSQRQLTASPAPHQPRKTPFNHHQLS